MLSRRCLPRLVGVTFVLFAVAAFAQPALRPLTHADFDSWRAMGSPVVSREGRWLAYSFMPQDGNGDVVVREISSGREHRVPVGALPPPPATPDENAPSEAPPPPRTVKLAFTSDSSFVVVQTYPTKEDVAAARRAKKKPEEMPKAGLAILDLESGGVTRVAEVKSFVVPTKGGAWLVYQKEGKPEAKPTAGVAPASTTEPEPGDVGQGSEPRSGGLACDAAEPPGVTPRPAATAPETTATSTSPAASATSPTPAATPPRSAATTPVVSSDRTFGTDLVLRQLATGAERRFDSVRDYSFARDGQTLLYTVSARTSGNNGVYAVTPGDSAKPVALLAGRGRYARLAWDRQETQVTFVSDRDAAGQRNARFKQYWWRRGTPAAQPVVSPTTKGLPAHLVVSDKAAGGFSRDGKKLYVAVGAAPKPSQTPPAGNGKTAIATTLPDEEKVTADLWHWRDGFVQTIQKVRANQERNRTYRGVFDLDAQTYTQLADASMATVTVSDDGLRALGYDDRKYRSRIDHEGRFSDVYLVNAATGERQLVLPEFRGESGSTLQWSPDGQWACYYQARQWHVLNTRDGTFRPLTTKLRVAFSNEDHDRPEPPPAYGSAGWTKDSSTFLVYDRYDVWQLFPDERQPRNVTTGYGRAQKLQLRVQRIEAFDADDDERGIDSAKPLVLRGESEISRATGFFQTTLAASTPPARLLWGDANHRYIARAQDADVLIVARSRFDEFPDLHATNSSFAELKKITTGGAQLEPFAWGRSELLHFKNADGVALSATLIKPANFDPKKKYPLIVYIYERLSQTVHSFVPPAPGTILNASFYTSNGYVVLMPDIVYRTGQPGPSALRCVLPAVDAAVRLGFVDEKAIGIQGHSWGGYQIAYMVTQTNRFRAAVAGAPVGNMTSAYSGIRWGSGLPRQFQYETGQSRIGQSLQAAAKTYLDNSPIFHVTRVNTPLLMMANDHDDAVPWYQGIELFLALRRHGKPSWLFNYNNALHGLRRRPDQKDWARRMQQYFDHYLKGAPAPAWLENGIPYIEREEEKEKFNAPRPLPIGADQ